MGAHHDLDQLRTFTVDVLMALGVREPHAHTTAKRMLEADVRGMAAHGIFRLPQYVRRIEAGGYNLDPDIRTLRENTVSALVDGDNGLGQVVVTRAVELALDKAREHGLAWVGTRASNHAGAAGVYAAMGPAHGLIGIYLAVGSANHLPPWGGVDPLLSTNPLAVAIPSGNEPDVVLDMATTAVSYGRVKLAAERGEQMPVGWMVDRQGEPLTDPTRSTEGFLLPIGGYKGYGLSLVIGLLAGVLNGAAFGSDVVDFTTDDHTPPNTGQAIFMMRPDLFQPLTQFRQAMDGHIRELRASTPMPGQPPVRLPGDQSLARAERAARDGIELGDDTVAALRALGRRLDVAAPESFGAG